MGRLRYGSGSVCERKILGQKVKIEVDSEGIFRASINGDYHTCDTLAGLLPKLRRSAQKARITVAIPATLVDVGKYTSGSHFHRKYLGVGCVDILLTGFDPRTDEIQFRNVDGTPYEKERHSRFMRDDIRRPMTKAEQAEWVRLHNEKERTRKAFEAYEKKFQMDARKVVKDALNAAVDDPKEAPTDESEDPRE